MWWVKSTPAQSDPGYLFWARDAARLLTPASEGYSETDTQDAESQWAPICAASAETRFRLPCLSTSLGSETECRQGNRG